MNEGNANSERGGDGWESDTGEPAVAGKGFAGTRRAGRSSWSLYGPMILRYLRRVGVGHQDAAELVRGGSVDRGPSHRATSKYDPARSFRAWLRKVATNRAFRFFAERGRWPITPGGTGHMIAVEEAGCVDRAQDELIEEECARGVWKWPSRGSAVRSRPRAGKRSSCGISRICRQRRLPTSWASRVGTVYTRLCARVEEAPKKPWRRSMNNPQTGSHRTCPPPETLSGWPEATRHPGMRRPVEKHLDVCAGCRERFDELSGGAEQLAEAAQRGWQQCGGRPGRVIRPPAGRSFLGTEVCEGQVVLRGAAIEPAPDRASSWPGWGDYDVVSVIGEGGMGIVSKAWHETRAGRGPEGDQPQDGSAIRSPVSGSQGGPIRRRAEARKTSPHPHGWGNRGSSVHRHETSRANRLPWRSPRRTIGPARASRIVRADSLRRWSHAHGQGFFTATSAGNAASRTRRARSKRSISGLAVRRRGSGTTSEGTIRARLGHVARAGFRHSSSRSPQRPVLAWRCPVRDARGFAAVSRPGPYEFWSGSARRIRPTHVV